MKPAWDKQPGLKTLPQQIDTTEKEIVVAVERLLVSLNQAKYTMVDVETFPAKSSGARTGVSIRSLSDLPATVHGYGSTMLVKSLDFLREQLANLFGGRKAYAAANDGNRANEIKLIYTAEPAIAYSFSGLSNEQVVQDVLNRLKRIGSKATFFAMESELRQHPNLVKRIVANGHEIGLAIRPKDGLPVDSIRKQILSGQKLLQSQYGVKTNMLKQTLGAIRENTFQAAEDVGAVMIGHSVTAVQTKHKDYASADQVMAELFPKSMHSLARGQIVHFRMDYYTNKLLVGDLIEAIKKQKIDNIAFSTFYDKPAIIRPMSQRTDKADQRDPER